MLMPTYNIFLRALTSLPFFRKVKIAFERSNVVTHANKFETVVLWVFRIVTAGCDVRVGLCEIHIERNHCFRLLGCCWIAQNLQSHYSNSVFAEERHRTRMRNVY